MRKRSRGQAEQLLLLPPPPGARGDRQPGCNYLFYGGCVVVCYDRGVCLSAVASLTTITLLTADLAEWGEKTQHWNQSTFTFRSLRYVPAWLLTWRRILPTAGSSAWPCAYNHYVCHGGNPLAGSHYPYRGLTPGSPRPGTLPVSWPAGALPARTDVTP